MINRHHIRKQGKRNFQVGSNLSPRIIFLFINNEPFVVEGTIYRTINQCSVFEKHEVDQTYRPSQDDPAYGLEQA